MGPLASRVPARVSCSKPTCEAGYEADPAALAAHAFAANSRHRVAGAEEHSVLLPTPTLVLHTAPHALYFSVPLLTCIAPYLVTQQYIWLSVRHPALTRCRLGVPSKDYERLFDPTPRPSITVTWFRQKIEVPPRVDAGRQELETYEGRQRTN